MRVFFNRAVLRAGSRLVTAPTRNFARYAPKGPKGPVLEPTRGVVDEDDEVPASEVRIPYVSEETRQEIYAKFKQDPQDKTFYKLASDYRMTITRMKAIVFLMRSREEMMAKNGVLDIGETEQRVYMLHKQEQERAQQLKHLKAELVEKKAADEKAAERLAKRKRKDPNFEPAPAESADELTIEEKIAQLEEAKAYTAEAIAEEVSLDVSKVKDIIRRLSEHYIRLGNLQGHENKMKELMEVLQFSGVDTNFSETSTEEDPRFDNTYYPRLFNDNEFDQVVREERINLLMKTKARYDPKVQDIMNKEYADNSLVKHGEMPNNAGVDDKIFLRSKFAFRDTSNFDTKKGATIIRKRDGDTRLATPLEEMKRSWGGKQPMYLETALHQQLIEMQLDPDRDDKKARDWVVARNEAKKALKEKAK